MEQPPFIAVVEDDPEIRSLVGGLLSREELRVVLCGCSEDLGRVIERQRVDLVVLDLMLGGEDGLSICRRLRGGSRSTPVLMATAKGDDSRPRAMIKTVRGGGYLFAPAIEREKI